MRLARSTPILLTLACVVACASNRFGAGFSMTDPGYFSEAPHIVATTEGYSLRWRYGTWGFFFQPESQVATGQLLFALQTTASSGSLSGREGALLITDPKQIHALERGGAFWLEPDGRRVRLELKR